MFRMTANSLRLVTFAQAKCSGVFRSRSHIVRHDETPRMFSAWSTSSVGAFQASVCTGVSRRALVNDKTLATKSWSDDGSASTAMARLNSFQHEPSISSSKFMDSSAGGGTDNEDTTSARFFL
jgi:hypothetical protein